MNLYKNLMFLQGYLVDPREASDDDALAAADARPAQRDDAGQTHAHARPLPPCPPRAPAARAAVGCLG